jgi:multidrug efflux system outer membrane protein
MKFSLMKKFILFVLIFVVTVSSGICQFKQGPEYKRPDTNCPETYRFSDEAPAKPSKEQVQKYLSEMMWWDFFQDTTLKELLTQAVTNNFTALIAAENIMQAQANLKINQANQFPFINLNLDKHVYSIPQKGSDFITTRENPKPTYDGNLSGSYQFDFWEKYSQATQQAKALMLSTIQARNQVFLTLINSVASAYFQLRALDEEIDTAKKSLAARQESLNLVQIRQEDGVVCDMDVCQSKQLVFEATIIITQLEQQRDQMENYIAFMLAKNPENIPRGLGLKDQLKEDPIMPGIPSSILANRPDVMSAEYQLIAANANISVARAAYFPQISLTGNKGYTSNALFDLFTGPSGAWFWAVNILQPIFNSGQIKAGVQISESQKKAAVFNYKQTIQNAFKEVSDSLIGYKKSIEWRNQQADATKNLAYQSELAGIRYIGGVSDYLEVQQTEEQYLQSMINLIKAELAVLTNLLNTYNALGGGWKQPTEEK